MSLEPDVEHEETTLDVSQTGGVDGPTKFLEGEMVRHTDRTQLRLRERRSVIGVEHGPVPITAVQTRET